MPPKKAEAPVPAEKDDGLKYLQRIQENVEAQEAGEQLCGEIMQDIVRRAEEQVLANYYDRTAIPYTVQGICKELLELVQIVFITRDTGDTSPEAVESWEADVEPEPCPTDTWARGAVPVRRRAESEQPRTTPTKTSKTRSGGPQPASRSGDCAPTPTASEVASKATKASAVGKPGGATGAAKPAADKAPAAAAAAAPAEEESAAGMQRLELKRRAEMKEAAERQHQALRELKPGREVVVDAINGKIIPVKPVDPKRLPTKRLDMKYGIDGPKTVQEEAAGAAPAAAKAAAEKKPAAKKKTAKNKWSEYVQPEDSHGPMVVGAAPTAGVTLRDGDTTQRNDMKVPKGRVTRAEYKKMMDALGVTRDANNTGDSQVLVQQQGSNAIQPDEATLKAKSEKTPLKSARAKDERKPSSVLGAPQGGGTDLKQHGTAVPSASPKEKKEPEYVKPQAVAPVPAHRQDARRGELRYSKRDRAGIPKSPKRDESRPAPLPPPLFPSSYGHGAGGAQSPATSQRTAMSPRTSARIQIAEDLDGNEVAEDFFQSLSPEI